MADIYKLTEVISKIVQILCFIGAAALVVMAFLPQRGAVTETGEEDKLPGGGGCYVLEVEGMDSLSRQAAVEAALSEFETLTATTDIQEGTVTVRYQGYPDLELLDAVKDAVEETGCTVREIE